MYMKEVENALTGVKDFGFELIYKYRKAQKLVLFNSVDIKNPKTILEAEVDEVRKFLYTLHACLTMSS